MNSGNKNLLFTFFVMLYIALTSFTSVFAGNESFKNKIETCDITNGASFSVSDDKYNFMVANPGTWQNYFKIKGTSTGKITLKLDPTHKTNHPAFTATANISVTYIDQSLSNNNFTTTLELDYDPAAGVSSTDIATYYFSDVHKMTITLTSITTNLLGNAVPDGVMLEGEIDLERYYNFDHTAPPTISHNITDVDASIDRTMQFVWPVVPGAEEYDLEWTFIDDYNSLALSKPIDFKNNATRITTSNNYYEIPLVYEKGYILYRVRGVGKLSPDFEQRVEGAWSSSAYSYSTVNDYTEKYYSNPHELDAFNWGYQSFFTENGIRGEGVSYFDGALKNRQNLSKLNTEDKVVVQETFYDYQGRPAVSVLPTPIDERTFKYRSAFNQNSSNQEYTADDFDIDNPTNPEMSTNSGASNYYSPLNPNQDGVNAYIPDAEEYPFTRTLYTNDLTGRVKSQGGLGANHAIGSGHESTFYYGKPLQHKLTALFGTDVGFSKAYSETMVIDPNGQASVSVMDASGRVIITNLAGNPPANLEAIPSHLAKEQITASILDNTVDYQDGYGSLTTTQAYISKAGGLHAFTYSLDPETYTECLPQGVCYDCVYDLTISVKDVYTMAEMITNGPFVVTIGGNNPLNNTCENTLYNSPTNGELEVELPIGSYIITKTLEVNQAAIDYYADQYMNESTCLDDYHSFFDAFIATTDFSGCNVSACLLSCEAQYGTSEQWLLANPTEDIEDYNTLINACIAACEAPKSQCEAYQYQMMLDMSKGGQYGLYYDFTNNVVDPSIFPLSVFNIENDLPDNYGNTTAGQGANWTSPASPYLDADGSTPSIIPVIDLGGSVYDPAVRSNVTVSGTPGAWYVYPDELDDVEDFLANWKPSWAYSLLSYHPEICYLGFLCDAEDDVNGLNHVYNSDLYDQDMLSVQRFDEANAAALGYLNPLNNAVPTTPTLNFSTSGADPFLTYLAQLTPAKDNLFKTALTSYFTDANGTIDIWQAAFALVYCPGSLTSTTDVTSCISTHSAAYFGLDDCRKDEVWQMFRKLYLAKKSEFFDIEMTNYAIENGCYNGCIGTATFDETAFNFNCYDSLMTPACATKSDHYDGTLDHNLNLNQPCSDLTYANYADKTKIFGTVYDDYSPANFPPLYTTVDAQMQQDIDDFCIASCADYADAWITQLADCGMSTGTENSLKAELIELCEIQCNPLSVPPLVTANGNATVEEVIDHWISGLYAAANPPTDAGCHTWLLMAPSPTMPIYAEDNAPKLADCGCDKVLQNEYDFLNVTPLPSGVTTSEELFNHTYGFVPLNYQNLVCECNNAAEADAGSWSPSFTWGTVELAYLTNLDMVVMEELACEECFSCSQMATIKADFDASGSYDFLSSDPNYELFLTNYINFTYNQEFSVAQIEEFFENCTYLGTPGNTVWGDTPERLHLEWLLKKTATWGDLFETTPIDLMTYIGTTSLEQHTTDYYYWSSATNACGNNTLVLNVGTQAGASQCTITLDLTTAIANGYNINFCNIISFSNLRKRGTTCTNTKDFYIDATIIDGIQDEVVTIEGTSTCYPIATCVDDVADLAICKENNFEITEEDHCTASLIQTAENNALAAYLKYLLEEKNKVTAALKNKCMLAPETFNMTYWDQEHHFTLYYYDQSGGLVQTVPPAGVKPFANPTVDIPQADTYRLNNSGVLTPPHVLETKYRYNSYNQLTEQKTPDAGVGKFWYDIAGRLVVSQNAKQMDEATYSTPPYSYTIYDDIGRIIEVGEIRTTYPINKTVAEDPTSLTTWYNSGTKTEITRTLYDETLHASIDAYFADGQENLRLRVATVAYYETDVAKIAYDNAIHYSYDMAGNVKYAVMENTDLDGLTASVKHLTYEYDLVSGNVKQVIFQQGETDQYYHKYRYDADNRIHEVLTSKNGIIWEKDAKYFYYAHGPLARIELGDEKVQGIDLAYTIQGWLKGVNSNTLDEDRDIGKDATQGYLANNPNIHQSVAKDAFGYTLSYFNGDYKAISQPAVADHFEAQITGTPFDVSNSELFNGNIRSMVTAITGMNILGNAYKYDQLNRLITSTVYDPVDVGSNRWASSAAITDYFTEITYDANGNIGSLLRNGTSAIQTAMDNMTYNYYTGTNKLADVSDAALDHASYSDIKSGMASNNYTYDAIGNLIADPSEQIDEIKWTVYGKVQSITRTATSTKEDLEFKYDAMGNRIMKLVKPRNGSGLDTEDNWTYTYYQYDAGGNILALYQKTFSNLGGGNYKAILTISEMNLYGSSRLGTDALGKTLVEQTFSATFDANQRFTNINITNTDIKTDDPNLVDRTLSKKNLELSNHLGNVLATVSDKKLPVTGTKPNTTITSSFEGGDYELFTTGSYAALQTITPVKTGTYAITTTSSSGYGPRIDLTDIKDGDVINASIWGNIYPAASGGSFILELKDACDMQVIATQQLQTLSTNPQTVDHWQQLGFNYTVPATGVENLVVTLRIYSPYGTTYWDDVSVDITHNTNQIIAYEADITSRQMYYPFGSVMPNANNLNAAGHTYGFNGQILDNEIKGNGNAYHFGGRSIYDGRLARFISVDPRWRDFPDMSPYAFAANNPIIFIDEDGEGPLDIIRGFRYSFTIGGIHYRAKVSFWNRQKIWFKAENTSGKLSYNFRSKSGFLNFSDVKNTTLGEKIGFSRRGSSDFMYSSRSQKFGKEGREFKQLEFNFVKVTKLIDELINQNSTEVEAVVVGNNNIEVDNAKQVDSDPSRNEPGNPYYGLSKKETLKAFNQDRANYVVEQFEWNDNPGIKILEAEDAFYRQDEFRGIKFTEPNRDAVGITIGIRIIKSVFPKKEIIREVYRSVRFL
tara:strand:- start:679 stop:9159 length:8481 start_codon:yes stop_codon:yes gene_type:complete